MSRAKPILAALVAATVVVAFSAMLAGPASAAWFVEFEELAAGQTAALASLPTVDESITLNTPSVGIKVSCKGPIHLTNGRIVGPDRTYADKVVFLDCNTASPSPTACKLEPALTEIVTKALLALATGGGSLTTAGSKYQLTFKPETGKVLAEIPFQEATACAFEGNVPLDGSVTLKAPTLPEEATTQTIEGLGSAENNSLELGSGHKTYLEKGKILLKLATGAEFAFLAPSILFEWTETRVKKIVTFTIKKKTGTPASEVIAMLARERPVGEWNLKGNEYKNCEGPYAINGACSFEAEYVGANMANVFFRLRDRDGNFAETSFTCTLAVCK